MPDDNARPGTHEAADLPRSGLDTDPSPNAESDESSILDVTDEPESPSKRPPWAALIVGAVVALLAVVYLVDWLVTKDDLQKGTRIGGVDVGGLSPEDAAAKLQSELAALSAPIPLQSHGSAVTLDPAGALSTDIPASVQAVGTRSANPFSRIGALFGSTTDFPVVATVDQPALTEKLTALAASSDTAAVEGELRVEGTTVVSVQPVTGQQLDVPAAAQLLTTAWTSGDPTTVNGLTLPVSTQPVRASPAATAAATAEASAILSGPLSVVAGETTIPVPLETIAAAVAIAPDAADGFTITVDEAAIKAAYQAQVDATQTQPADSTVTIVDNAPVITPAVDGRTVDWTATDAALAAALRAPDHVLTVAYSLTPAAISTEAMQALGIKEVVSEFTTGGFAYDSGQNVKRTAEQVQGAVVMPGETFSLNGYTGPRGAAQGYVEAGIIENGVPARAVGGGISQFATTLFNASYFAGMEDIEHKAHSYYISRYPPGREATVFEAEDGSSVIDVKFKNVSSTAILIQTIWTEDDITVRFWGTKSVEVESIAGDRYNYTSPPTKTIPYGETCSPTNGSQGFSIDVTKVIRDLAGTELSRETSTTVYNGQVKISCAPPPPAPDPAPATTPGG